MGIENLGMQSGHTAAVPPRSVMNERRSISPTSDTASERKRIAICGGNGCQMACNQLKVGRGLRSGVGPGCVKTCTSRECAELFSLFSSFDGDCQSGSFLIQRNRDKLSTRKFDVGVFTQPGSKTGKAQCQHMFSALPLRADIAQQSRHVRFVPRGDSCTAANDIAIRSLDRRWR